TIHPIPLLPQKSVVPETSPHTTEIVPAFTRVVLLVQYCNNPPSAVSKFQLPSGVFVILTDGIVPLDPGPQYELVTVYVPLKSAKQFTCTLNAWPLYK